MYRKIGVAVAFSPRCGSIVAEAVKLQHVFGAELVFIHIGKRTDALEQYLMGVIEASDAVREKSKLVWAKGFTAYKIISVCKAEQIDLLVLGALKRENILKYHIGSVARHVLRKAEFSVLTLITPSVPPKKINRILVNATEGKQYINTLVSSVEWAKLEGASHLVVFKAIKLFGLSMAITGEDASEDNYDARRRKIIADNIKETEKLLAGIDTGNLHVNIKIAAGKAGHELKKCAIKTKADLVVVQSPGHKLGLLDRFFPHYLEHILWDLPCNLLVNKR
jgi:nucleotide-binding universal stress UspA family protein